MNILISLCILFLLNFKLVKYYDLNLYLLFFVNLANLFLMVIDNYFIYLMFILIIQSYLDLKNFTIYSPFNYLILIILLFHKNINFDLFSLFIIAFLALSSYFKLLGTGDLELFIFYSLFHPSYDLLRCLNLCSLFALIYFLIIKKRDKIAFYPFISLAIILTF